MNLHVTHHVDPATLCLLRDIHRGQRLIMERLKLMATAEQVTKLGTDVDALISTYEQKIADLEQKIADLTAAATPPAPVADPAIDAIDATVIAATAKATAPPA